MTYRYACFISYKRPPTWQASPGNPAPDPSRHFLAQFAEVFQQELDSFLSLSVRSFRDVNLSPGSKYPRELSQNLCLSLCLVALVVPQYFESEWCMAEWRGMAKFEQTRSRTPLIIPVLISGDMRMLERQFEGRKAFDLRGVSTPTRQLRSNPRVRGKVQTIADMINNMGSRLKGAALEECDAFSLGLGPDSTKPLFPEKSPMEG